VTRVDEQPDFDALASRAAAAIRDSTKGSSQGATVLLVDFRERSGPVSELGHQFYSVFDAALRKHSQGFIVLNSSDLEGAISSHHLPEAILSSAPAMVCYAPELGATVYIEGILEIGSDKVYLELIARQSSPRKAIFRENISFKITPSMRDAADRLAPAPPPIFTDEEKVWVNPDQLPATDGRASQPANRRLPNSLPECEYCPQPGFSDDAILAKFQGTVDLRVLIRADGIPAKISLVRGIPCGLTEKAIETVEHWRFKPATGPDGEPEAVEQTVEVTFRLY